MRFGPKKDSSGNEKKPSAAARWHKAALAAGALLAVGPASQMAPPPASAPPAPTAPAYTHDLPGHFHQRISSTTCIPAANLNTSDRYPQIRPVFERMSSQAPLSGAPVIARITAEDEDVNACTSRALPDGTLVAAYESPTRRLIVATRNVAPGTVAHEAFHARQHITGGFNGVASNRLLTAGDRATGMLLIEATAAAYSLVVLKEIGFTDPDYARRHMGTHDYGMLRTFNTAFDASYAANATQSETERRRIALEAGGQAVVRALMNGQSSEWRGLYRSEAQRFTELASFSGARNAEYTAIRDREYARIGQVAPNMQLVPVEFMGSRGNDSIATSQRASGLRITPPPADRPFASSARRPAA